MSETIQKQNKETKRKEARKAKKAARKAANVAKVEETKVEKAKAEKAKVEKAKVEKTKMPEPGPVIRKVKDIWEAIDLEKKGISVNANGEYTLSKNKNTEEGCSLKKRGPRRLNRKGHTLKNKVCVVTSDGDHVRVNREIAKTLVAAGGKYIPKHMFKGKIKGNDVDWSHKK